MWKMIVISEIIGEELLRLDRREGTHLRAHQKSNHDIGH